MHRHPFLVRFLVTGWLAATPVWAATDGWSFTVRTENDLPVNSDRYYTNGVSFPFARCTDERDALWPTVLRLSGLDRPGLLATGFDLGQVMVTPADVLRAAPDPRDRPYAGLLFFGASWQRLADDHYAALKLITGGVGPPSLAEQTQMTVHRTLGVALPRGWDHQLRTEPILNAVYERRWRAQTWGRPEGWNGDAMLVGGAMLGNVLTQASTQVQVRVGWRTPRDFGSSLIRGIGALPPACDAAPWGAHAFAGLGGFAVARNITLDGNSFRSGPKSWAPAVRPRRRSRRGCTRAWLAAHHLVERVGPRVRHPAPPGRVRRRGIFRFSLKSVMQDLIMHFTSNGAFAGFGWKSDDRSAADFSATRA